RMATASAVVAISWQQNQSEPPSQSHETKAEVIRQQKVELRVVEKKNRPRQKWRTGGGGIVCVAKPFSDRLDNAGGAKATISFQSFAVLPLHSALVSAYTALPTPFAWKAQLPKL
ncbi:MAG: hypothetical protein AAGH89_03060, partial [Verrucomicrobiota bacterium]